MSQNPSSPDSAAADVTAPAESTNGHASNGHRVNTRSGRNGSRQYQLSNSDLITDDRTNDDIFETEISEEVYGQNYQYGTDDRVPDTWYRNARATAQVEDDTDVWTQRFYQLLSGKGLGTGPFPFTPGGRIFANAGTGLGKATLINCFVSGFQGHDQDSMDEIQAELTRQAKILASEGGYGFCAHIMRPRGARIGGVGSMTPGAVQMLDVWNKQAATIVAGSGMKSDRDDVKDKIRKGAQMVTMGIWHPDIIEFIEAKQEPGRLHKFNMSVLITDAFMEAVKNDDTWALRFPDYENEKEFYKQHWDGNLKAYQEKGGTVKTWKDPATGEPAVYEAREIWNRIMDSTYNRNEPGVIFVDTINKENNLGYVEHINATNPCVTGDTWVMTGTGPRQVRQLLDEPFEAIVDGEAYSATNFFQTGTKDVLRLETKEGYELQLTRDHEVRVATDVGRYSIEKEWREAQNLEPGDKVVLHDHRDVASWSGAGDDEEGYLAGLFVGDGSVGSHGPVMSVWEDGHSASIRGKVMECVQPMDKRSDFRGWYALDERNEHRLRLAAIDRMLERFDLTGKSISSKVEEASSEFYRGFLRGFFDADGSVQGSQTKGVSVRLHQSDLDRLKAVQRMLLRLGIASTIYQNRREEGERELPNGKGGTDFYNIQAQHELVISNDNLQQFADRVGFAHDGKQNRLDAALDSYDRAMNRERFVATVQSIDQDGTEPVYDTTVEEVHSFDANGLYVHNCGEQVLPVGGVCLLGNLNVTQLVDREAGTIDYDLVDDLVPRAVRFLDNVNDLSYVPLEEQQRNLQEKRRIGLGHYGDGSALMMMKTRYGSEEGARVMREFQEHLANRAYQASARLAEEKGAFPLFDKDEYLSSPFVQRLSDKTKEMIGDLGLRNSHLLSIQPTGNTSTLGNAPSSGIEPVFMHSYIRTSEQPALPEGINRPPMSPNAYEVGQDIDADGTAWTAEEQGDETVLRCQEEGHTHWQIHPTRDICKDQEVKDYAVRHMETDGTWDPDADWAVTTRDLDVDDHLTQMKALAPFVDSSMSKCVVEGTRIQTSRGPVRIEEFYNGEKTPDTFSEPAFEAKASDGQGNMKPITKAYYGGEKPCVEVTVSTGETIQCSRTHKLLTPSGWTQASELEEGEHIAINHVPVDTDLRLQPLPQPDFANAISRAFPSHLNEAFARFLGMWFADGSINENSIRIHEKDEDVRRVATGLLNQLFGDCKTQTDCRTGVRTHEVHSRPLAQYFREQYGEGASEKAPPEALFRSPTSVKRAFLEGLTLDGYVDKTQSERLTVYEGYSKSLRDAAAHLLAELGVRVHLREKEVQKTSVENEMTFSVRAYLRNDALSPVEMHKREYSTRAFGSTKRRVQNPERYMELPATDHSDYIGRRNLRRSLKDSTVVQKSALDALGVGYDDTLGWTKTTGIRDVGRKPVYDVEVADTHSYRVGNIVSHNTVNVPNDYPFEDFKELYKKAHDTGVIKGVTTYRAGTMSAVLSGDDDGDDDRTVPRTEAPDRPETLPCAIHRVRYQGDHWTILVGFLEDHPYEVFAFKSEGEAPLFGDDSERVDEGYIRKNESRHYSLLGPNGTVVIGDITSHMPSDDVRVETRLVSTALRHGSKIDFLVEQLEKAEGSIASFGQSMAKALRAHATDHEVTCDKCGSANVRHVEGCMECADCGHSRCS